MIAEAIAKLEELAAKSFHPTELDLADNTREFYLVNGQVREFEIRRHRCHEVDRVASLIEAAKHWGIEGAIFHGHNCATLVCKVDSADRLDRVVLPLILTDKAQKIRELADGERRWFSQAEFVRLLRFELAGVFPKALLAAVRQVMVSGQGSKGGEIQHGRERGVQEFQRELAKAEQFPEEAAATFDYYRCADLHSQVTVRAALDIDLDRVAFGLDFDADELAAVHQDVQQGLHEALEAACECPIFYGAP